MRSFKGSTATLLSLALAFLMGVAWRPLVILASGILAPAYQVVQNAGAPLAQRIKLNFVNGGCADNAGTGVTDCTVSSSGGLLTFAGNQAPYPSTTVKYYPLGGGGAGNATEAVVQTKLQAVMTFRNACVSLQTAPGGSDTVTVFLRNGGANTAITVVITGAAVSGCDTTHTVTNAAGDVMNWSIVSTATGVSNVTIQFNAQVGI